MKGIYLGRVSRRAAGIYFNTSIICSLKVSRTKKCSNFGNENVFEAGTVHVPAEFVL